MTDLSRVLYVRFSNFPAHREQNKITKWRQYSCTCAKATGTESFRPTLQRVLSDEGGKEEKFYEVKLLALRRSAMTVEM